MLTNIFFQTKSDRAIISEILNDFHVNGPVSQNHLETLAYIKINQSGLFKEYEQRLMFYMGLFHKTSKPTNFVEAIYNSYAEAIIEDTGRKFTPVQADAYNSIKQFTNFSFSAPTSAGKSYLFLELVKEIDGDILIVIPSRALLSEYLIKVTRTVPITTLVLPFIDIVNTKKTIKRIFIITPERGEELFKNIDKVNLELVLFDEAQLSEDGLRGLKFDSFVRRIDKKFPNVKKVFTHPFVLNPDAQFTKHNIKKQIGSESYKHKTVGKIYLHHAEERFRYFSPFEDHLKGKSYEGNFVADLISDGKTILLYVSKKSIYDGEYLDEFSTYISQCDEIDDKEAIKLIEKIEEYFGTKKDREKHSDLISMMKRGIVIHHGSIPLKARLIIEEFVNRKFAKICFSTSTLIQGINMPFDCVWITYFNFNGSDGQKILSLKNLIGRAGRTSLEVNTFDYGYVIVQSRNKLTFTKRLNKESSLSETSELDNVAPGRNEDFIDIVEAIQQDSFNAELHLTEVQLDRIRNSGVDGYIEFVLDHFFNIKQEIITANTYYQLTEYKRKKIKKALELIYKAHLRRPDLTEGEKAVLSTAIPILLWAIQGKSFAEIVALRYSFLSQRDYRASLARQFRNKDISEIEYQEGLERKVRFSCIAHAIPDKSFKKPFPLFPNTNIEDINFDKLIYDTYDYLDKVISFSLRDPLYGALILYFRKTGDSRAQTLSNYVKFGTNDSKEILLLRYGFTFDEIEKIRNYVESIDETQIVFTKNIEQFIKDNPEIQLVSRYL